MNLFGPVIKKITIPACILSKTSVGSNKILRYMNKKFVHEFSIEESRDSRFYELKSSLPKPFDTIYLKKWGSAANIPKDAPCLKFKSQNNHETLSKDTELLWIQKPNSIYELTVQDVVKSWNGLFQFREENPAENILGLRKPQLGAVHAISAYFATDKELEPATVVLPTGTGKTETMLSTLIYQQCQKVLILVPSNSLRTQISNKFLNLGYLSELGIIPPTCALPYVSKITKSIKTTEEAEELATSANIFVATTDILKASDQNAVNALCNRCSHLFVDEAHHISATTWQAVRDRFNGRKVIQFTATPFRNDGNTLGGRIIYNYSMGEAQRAGYFTKINFVPVEEYFDDYGDIAIARKGIEILKRDLADNRDHLMMARVNTRPRAEQVYKLYLELAPELHPIIVHSGYGKSEIQKRLDTLLSRQSKIVICVDMLGEGYDLPNLKVAAIHDHHKSLAITLQFIGRFTRSSYQNNVKEASVVMNIADPDIEGDLQRLYAQGADWDTVLRYLSENRIEREIRLQEIVDALRDKGNLHKQISLWNLKPSYTAMLFKTSCMEWSPEEFDQYLPKFKEYWYSIAEEENILVLLAVQSTPVKWGTYKELSDTNYKLLIAQWDRQRQALFIFSNDYKVFRIEKMAEALCQEKCELMCGEKIFNIFNGMEYPLARNLGASQIGAISFTQFFGSNVTDGLSQIEKSQSTLSNIACLGYEHGEKVVWGCSQKKGKVWSPQKGGAISDWSDWVKIVWDKIAANGTDNDNITKNFLRPSRIETFHTEYPISVQWGEHLLTAYEDKVSFFFGNVEVPFYLVEISVDGIESDGCIRLVVASENTRSIYKLEISKDLNSKGYEYHLIEGERIQLQKGTGDLIDFAEYMVPDPVMIYYADGSFSYNNFLVKVPSDIGQFKQEHITAHVWHNIDIKKESMGYEKDQQTIQYEFYKSIENDYDIIINDDGSGESADLVALRLIDNEILLTLVHCKFSLKNEAGARLKDLYEVCGQAQRSVRWKHLKLHYLYHHIKHRESLWHKKRYSRFLKGSIADLATMKNRSRTTTVNLQVVIVQPGLSKTKVTEEMLKLLGSTEIYLKKTAMADLIVYGSA